MATTTSYQRLINNACLPDGYQNNNKKYNKYKLLCHNQLKTTLSTGTNLYIVTSCVGVKKQLSQLVSSRHNPLISNLMSCLN